MTRKTYYLSRARLAAMDAQACADASNFDPEYLALVAQQQVALIREYLDAEAEMVSRAARTAA